MKKYLPNERGEDRRFLAGSDGLPDIPADYKPAEDPSYMSPLMQAYFKRKLLKWRDQIMTDVKHSLEAIQRYNLAQSKAFSSGVFANNLEDELLTLGFADELLAQINSALERIYNGTYGFCERTGEPLSLEKLEMWPMLTFIEDSAS